MAAHPDERLAVGRLLDAAANRVREGLRVMEDVARFCWDDGALVEPLKTLRHDLTAAIQSIERSTGPLVLFRDTPGDVGTGLTTAGEKVRADSAALFSANAKRVQEGFRSLEEGIKLLALESEAANPFKALRYTAYTIESDAVRRHPVSEETATP
ncbi:MAG: hypothetical protein ABI743_01890 [bacterium]